MGCGTGNHEGGKESSPRKILLIDDEYVTLALLEDMLTAKGYSVITATKASLGLQEATYSRPDLIILDIILPDSDGFFVLAELKKNERTKNIPVILLSALSDSQALRTEAAAAFVHKPIRQAEILETVERIIGPA